MSNCTPNCWMTCMCGQILRSTNLPRLNHKELGVEAYAYNPSTEAEARRSEFKASLWYIASSRPVLTTWWDPILKNKKWKQTQNLCRSITSTEIEPVIKRSPDKKLHTWCLHWWVLPNILKRPSISVSQTFPKIW
jgi:hypothetical protein